MSGETPARPSRLFAWAAVLGGLSVLPLVALLVWGVVDTLEDLRSSWMSDLLLIAAVLVLGVFPVPAAAGRMLRRPERPVLLFLLALAASMVPSFVALTIMAVGRGAFQFFAFLLALIAAVIAMILAITARVLRR